MLIFSPMATVASLTRSDTVLEASSTKAWVSRVSTSAGLALAMCLATLLQKLMKLSVLATKSVSQLTSTMTPTVPSSEMYWATTPSAAMRLAFLAAWLRPFSRSHSMAFSISPSLSTRAFLQSIMPALVRSRSSLTIAEVTAAIGKTSLKIYCLDERRGSFFRKSSPST